MVPGDSSHTQVASDDISSLIAFGPGKIGVLWSNQRVSPKTFNFIVHDDSAADTAWGASVAITGGSRFGDDHINLKSLHTDGSGRIFAVIKTSNTVASDPLIVVLTRSSAGSWSLRTVWTKGNNLTRPLVLVDTSNGLLHAFASTEGGGKVYYKSATLTGSFPTGLGTVVMSDDAQNDINNVTSGKGNVNSTTGIVVLASNQTTQRYWHYFNALGGGGGNATPVCSNRSLTVAQDSTGGDVAPSCTDSDGPSALTYAISAQGTKGVASVTAATSCTTPRTAASPAPTPSRYTAFDGAATSAPATVNVTITPSGGNATPVCSNRSLTVAQDSTGGDVAPSCTDSDGPSALTYAISAQGTKGVASVTGGNQLHYTPNGGQSGADTFTLHRLRRRRHQRAGHRQRHDHAERRRHPCHGQPGRRHLRRIRPPDGQQRDVDDPQDAHELDRAAEFVPSLHLQRCRHGQRRHPAPVRQRWQRRRRQALPGPRRFVEREHALRRSAGPGPIDRRPRRGDGRRVSRHRRQQLRDG